MTNKGNNEQLDASIKEALKSIEVPYDSANWEDMSRVLEKNPKKYSLVFSDYSQYIVVGIIGIFLIGGLVYMIFRGNMTNENSLETTEEKIIQDTFNLYINSSAIQDSIKNIQLPITQTITVSEPPVDSILKQEQEISDQADDDIEKKEKSKKNSKKKKSEKDSTDSDTSKTKKQETSKKKKKKKSDTTDSNLKSSPAAIDLMENIDKSLPAEEKPVKDSTR